MRPVSAAASADGSYSGLDPADVSVTNSDDDVAGVTDGQAALDRVAAESFDLVVTVCDHAAETCPVVPGSTPTIPGPGGRSPRSRRQP